MNYFTVYASLAAEKLHGRAQHAAPGEDTESAVMPGIILQGHFIFKKHAVMAGRLKGQSPMGPCPGVYKVEVAFSVGDAVENAHAQYGASSLHVCQFDCSQGIVPVFYLPGDNIIDETAGYILGVIGWTVICHGHDGMSYGEAKAVVIAMDILLPFSFIVPESSREHGEFLQCFHKGRLQGFLIQAVPEKKGEAYGVYSFVYVKRGQRDNSFVVRISSYQFDHCFH
jgi:hypothetical protein